MSITSYRFIRIDMSLSVAKQVEFLEGFLAELRAVGADGRYNPERAQGIKDIMGVNFVEPENGYSKLLNGAVANVGLIKDFPQELESVLIEPCPFIAGKEVSETHILFWEAQELDGKPYTLLELRDNAIKLHEKQKKSNLQAPPIFYDPGQNNWFLQESFADKASSGRWVLMPKEGVLKTKGLNWDAQELILRETKYKNYQTINSTALVTGIVLFSLVSGGQRIFADHYGWCSDQTDASGAHAGLRVCAGFFHADGLSVDRRGPSLSNGYLRRAVFRKFSSEGNR